MHLLVTEQLRHHVRNSPYNTAHEFSLSSQSEIPNFHNHRAILTLLHKHILRLHIAMAQIKAVQLLNTIGYLP